MKIIETTLPGVLIVEPTIYRDDRGHFLELWRRDRVGADGLPPDFVQDNVSRSVRGVLRGLHYQHPTAQGKLVSVLVGRIFDVAVDIRRDSPTFGQWVGAELDADRGRQLYIPEGFAHGFLATSDEAIVLYKCTRTYVPREEGSILWNDPDLGIEWPPGVLTLSGKDREAPRLSQVDLNRLPIYRLSPDGDH